MPKKLLSVFLSACLVWTSGNLAEATLEVPKTFPKPAFLPRYDLVPPPSLGRVTDYYAARPESCVLSHESNTATSARDAGPKTHDPRLVVLIQDLHANVEVQLKIARLLEFLGEKLQAPHLYPPPRPPHTGPAQVHRRLFLGGPRGGRMKEGVKVPFAVAVEGAEGPVDSAVMALFPDEKIKEEALLYLMKEGELTGMEYFAAMHKLPSLLVGVEDLRYYNAHKELFQKTLQSRSQLGTLLAQAQKDLLPLRNTFYTRKMKALQRKIEAWQKGQIPLETYVAYLDSLVQTYLDPPSPHSSPPQRGRGKGEGASRFPAFNQYRQALNAPASSFLQRAFGKLLPQKSFEAYAAYFKNPQQLKSETMVFLKTSYGRFALEEVAKLQELAKQEATAYYLYLHQLSQSHGLLSALPKNLGRYLQYLSVSHSVNFQQLHDEMEEIVFELKKAMAAEARTPSPYSSPPSRGRGKGEGVNPVVDLVHVERDLKLLTDMLDLKATEYEVKAFAPRFEQFIALANALLQSVPAAQRSPLPLKGGRKIKDIRPLVSAAIDYYVLAFMRNKPMVDRTLELLTPSPYSSPPPRGRGEGEGVPHAVVLVAGGFHTSGITQVLKERNVSYAVICPAIEKDPEPDRALYVKRLSGVLLSTEEILQAAHGRTTTAVVGRPLKVSRGRSGGNSGRLALAGMPLLVPSRVPVEKGDHRSKQGDNQQHQVKGFKDCIQNRHSSPFESQIAKGNNPTNTTIPVYKTVFDISCFSTLPKPTLATSSSNTRNKNLASSWHWRLSNGTLSLSNHLPFVNEAHQLI